MKCDHIDKSDEDSLREEANIHLRLSHPNIIKCLGVFLEPGNHGIIFELAEHGELRNYLKKKEKIKTRLDMLHEVSSGMKYLHSLNPPVIHGDLKIQNILVGENHKAKLCDFGFSRWKNYSQSRSAKDVPRGTSTHIPPEYLKDSQLRKTEKFDVYSLSLRERYCSTISIETMRSGLHHVGTVEAALGGHRWTLGPFLQHQDYRSAGFRRFMSECLELSFNRTSPAWTQSVHV